MKTKGFDFSTSFKMLRSFDIQRIEIRRIKMSRIERRIAEGVKIAILVIALAIVSLVRPLSGAANSSSEPAAASSAVRFASVDIFIDPQGFALAAYQFEFSAETGDVSLVGIEGGVHPAFVQPPYYDPAALSQHRVIIAAFNTGSNLPTARTRVARLHLRIGPGVEPKYSVRLMASGGNDGKSIPASAQVGQGEMLP